MSNIQHLPHNYFYSYISIHPLLTFIIFFWKISEVFASHCSLPINRPIGIGVRKLAMELMTHSSTFLLPNPSADNGAAPTYVLVVLNRRLPRFTPLLWEHGNCSCTELVFYFLPESTSRCGDILYLSFPVCFVEQHNFVSAQTAERTDCMMNCRCYFPMKTIQLFVKGSCVIECLFDLYMEF